MPDLTCCLVTYCVKHLDNKGSHCTDYPTLHIHQRFVNNDLFSTCTLGRAAQCNQPVISSSLSKGVLFIHVYCPYFFTLFGRLMTYFHSCKWGKRTGKHPPVSQWLLPYTHWFLLILHNAHWVKTHGCHINLYQPILAAKSMLVNHWPKNHTSIKYKPSGKPTWGNRCSFVTFLLVVYILLVVITLPTLFLMFLVLLKEEF